MICRNCQTNVDNDLIFCVNCGNRLIGRLETNQAMPAPTTIPFSTSQKKKPLILIALALFLFAGLLTALLGVAFWLNSSPKTETTEKASSSEKNINAGYPKNTQNHGADDNSLNKQPSVNTENTTNGEKTIVDETLTIGKNEHKVFPYQITDNSTMLRGQAELLEGETFRAYVLIKETYDTFLADPTYEIFGFKGKRGEIIKINEFTSADKYVLVVENKGNQPVSLKIKLFLKEVE